MPVQQLSAVGVADCVDVLQASWRIVSRAYAEYFAALVDVAEDEAGSPEWAGAEIGAALTFTDRRAGHELFVAEALVRRMPLVFAALHDGELDHYKARVFADYLHGLTEPQIERICERTVAGAVGWTTGQLARRLLKEVQAIDPEYTRKRYEKALAERDVLWFLDEHGTATLAGNGLSPPRPLQLLSGSMILRGRRGPRDIPGPSGRSVLMCS